MHKANIAFSSPVSSYGIITYPRCIVNENPSPNESVQNWGIAHLAEAMGFEPMSGRLFIRRSTCLSAFAFLQCIRSAGGNARLQGAEFSRHPPSAKRGVRCTLLTPNLQVRTWQEVFAYTA